MVTLKADEKKQLDSQLEQKQRKIIIKRSDGSIRVCTPFYNPSRTNKEFEREVNINNIMKRYKATGELPRVRAPGHYGDFSKVSDFFDATLALNNARDAFADLPAAVRRKFDNNPGNLLRFLQDPKNHEEAIKMGLLAPDPNSPSHPPTAAPAPAPQPSQPIPPKEDKKKKPTNDDE